MQPLNKDKEHLKLWEVLIACVAYPIGIVVGIVFAVLVAIAYRTSPDFRDSFDEYSGL